MYEAVCTKCITDLHLQHYIHTVGAAGDCDFCGAENTRVADVEGIIDFLRQRILEEYRPVDEECPPYDPEEGRYFVETFDVADILEDELGEFPADGEELRERILDGLGDQLWCQKDWTMLSRDEGLSSGWREFCHAIKHETRYLFFKENEEVEEQDREFVEPGRMLAELGSLARTCGLFRTLEAGSEYWRVRWDKEGKRFETPSEMGPPPESKAKQSRMTAAGIPAFYLEEKPETALAETRDAGRGTASYGKFKLLRDLTVLELVKIPGIPSILSKGRVESRPNIKFLHEFVRDVSKPIERDENVHFEYTPTQVVTEYFRKAFRIEKETTLDGIAYPSSRGDGDNFVLFYDRRNVVGIEDDYFSKSGTKYFELTLVKHQEFEA